MEHIESIGSLESELYFDSICSIRIRSRNQDKNDFQPLCIGQARRGKLVSHRRASRGGSISGG